MSQAISPSPRNKQHSSADARNKHMQARPAAHTHTHSYMCTDYCLHIHTETDTHTHTHTRTHTHTHAHHMHILVQSCSHAHARTGDYRQTACQDLTRRLASKGFPQCGHKSTHGKQAIRDSSGTQHQESSRKPSARFCSIHLHTQGTASLKAPCCLLRLNALLWEGR